MKSLDGCTFSPRISGHGDKRQIFNQPEFSGEKNCSAIEKYLKRQNEARKLQKEKEMWNDHIRLGGGASEKSFEERYSNPDKLSGRVGVSPFEKMKQKGRQQKQEKNKENISDNRVTKANRESDHDESEIKQFIAEMVDINKEVEGLKSEESSENTELDSDEENRPVQMIHEFPLNMTLDSGEEKEGLKGSGEVFSDAIAGLHSMLHSIDI